jgi:hypothetical protein
MTDRLERPPGNRVLQARQVITAEARRPIGGGRLGANPRGRTLFYGPFV